MNNARAPKMATVEVESAKPAWLKLVELSSSDAVT